MTALAVVAKVTAAALVRAWRGQVVTPVHCLPSLCGGSTGWGWGTPRQLCSYPGVLQTAGAITAHHRDLGLVRVKWLHFKPIFRRGRYDGGIASSPMLQERGAPVSAWLCGIFQTLQERGVGGRGQDMSEGSP